MKSLVLLVAVVAMIGCGEEAPQPLPQSKGGDIGDSDGLPLAPEVEPKTESKQQKAYGRTQERVAMVKQLLAGCDIQNKPVLEAMRRVPRHLFIPENMRRDAYEDHPVPIGQRQTISQPYIVAFMTQALKLEKDDRVLEIGTGSGYQAAILGELTGEIYTIEIIPHLGNDRKSCW